MAESCHGTSLVVTGGTGGCHSDNIRCHRWHGGWYRDDFGVQRCHFRSLRVSINEPGNVFSKAHSSPDQCNSSFPRCLPQITHKVPVWKGRGTPGICIPVWTRGRNDIFLSHIDGLVQERPSSALAMKLRLSCTNPSIHCYFVSRFNCLWILTVQISMSIFNRQENWEKCAITAVP